MMQVFDFATLDKLFRQDPAKALHELAEAVDHQQMQVRFRGAMPIAGAARAKHDTVRLTLDVDVQLVQHLPVEPVTECNHLEPVTERHQLPAFRPGLDD